jgi:hypothetical protein
MVESTTVANNQITKLGEQWSKGLYVVDVIQGNERITLKLIKQ